MKSQELAKLKLPDTPGVYFFWGPAHSSLPLLRRGLRGGAFKKYIEKEIKNLASAQLARGSGLEFYLSNFWKQRA